MGLTLTLGQGICVGVVWIMAVLFGALLAHTYDSRPRKTKIMPVERWVAWEMDKVDSEYETLVNKK
jgi:hypothetical protein